jgi:uncharacterized membrane protein YcaP (DUF421 family)
VTVDEVMEAVREHGLDKLSDVLTATLEVDGSISVIGVDRMRVRRFSRTARHPRGSVVGGHQELNAGCQ